MAKYIFKRICLMLITAFAIMTILFILIRLLPNHVHSVVGGNKEQLEAMRDAWGYNEPLIVQYGIFLKNVFTKWDWGFCTEIGTMFTPVTEYVAAKTPATLYINIISIIISIPLGVLFGIVAANFKNRWQDHLINIFILIFISVPPFIYAFLLQYIVGFKWNLLPLVMESGTDYFSPEMFKSAILPIMALSFGIIAGDMRYVRAEIAENMNSEYMLFARAKGLSKRQALMRHALRNSMVPLLPTFLTDVVSIITGSLIVEQIFSVPGLGKTYLLSIVERDYSVFLYISMIYVTIDLIAGLVFDIFYGIVDPRIRMGGGKTNEL